MTVTLNLKPEVATQEAATWDTALQDYIKTVIAEAAKRQPPPLSREEQLAKNQAALAMLKEWDEEDKTDDPVEIAKRQAEWEEFKQGMNENHTSSRILFP